MNSYLCHIETGVPPYVFSQGDLYNRLMQDYPEAASRRILKALFAASGIETRHSVLPDAGMPRGEGELFWKDEWPRTGARNRVYARECPALAIPTARRALINANISPGEVTHVITVSCTGFYSPGLDCELIHDLRLSPSIQRYHLGFMGCYAAIPALRMAHQYCCADRNAVVLIMCVELCSLHLRPAADIDTFLANTLFADGAAAAIVTGIPCSESYLQLGTFYSHLAAEAEQHMAWTIQDDGFHMRLSSQIPELIERNVRRILPRDIDSAMAEWGNAMLWAVHPGGRAILDKLQQALSLPPTALLASHEVLRRYGNMSSPTVLFVMKEIAKRVTPGEWPLCAMAFGPGLTLESLLGTIVCKSAKTQCSLGLARQESPV